MEASGLIDAAVTPDPDNLDSPSASKTAGSYKDRLMNHVPQGIDDSMEEGEIPEEEYDSEDDIFLEREGGPTILFSKEEKRGIRSPWRQALIIKLLGRNIGYTYLCNRLKQIWSIQGQLQVIDLDHGYYCLRFSDPKEYDFVFTGGPWIIADHYLSVRRWTPCFRSDEATIDKVAAWIRLPIMPMEFYDDFILKKVAAPIGKFIRIDKTTSYTTRGKFAIICIEVDLTQPLVQKVFIGGRWQRVEYEALRMLCFHCGKFGHDAAVCPSKQQAQPTTSSYKANSNVDPKKAVTRETRTFYLWSLDGCQKAPATEL